MDKYRKMSTTQLKNELPDNIKKQNYYVINEIL